MLRPFPVVPVFGDIPFSPINVLKLAKYWKQLQADGQLKEHFIPSSLAEPQAQEFAQARRSSRTRCQFAVGCRCAVRQSGSDRISKL